MKVNTIKIKKYKLFKINLLKTQLHKYKTSLEDQNNLLEYTLDDLEVYFKQIFKIIFDYHINRRKIFFVGFPSIKNDRIKKLLKQTKHIFIPNLSWVNGFMHNKNVLLRNFIKKRIPSKKLNLFLSIKKAPDLVVVFNPTKELGLIQEFSRLKVPIIIIGEKSGFYNSQILYNIPVDPKFSFKSPHNIFNSLLYSIFKRSLKRLNYFIPKYFFLKKGLHKFQKRRYFYRVKKSRIFIDRRRKRHFRYKNYSNHTKNIQNRNNSRNRQNNYRTSQNKTNPRNKQKGNNNF